MTILQCIYSLLTIGIFSSIVISALVYFLLSVAEIVTNLQFKQYWLFITSIYVLILTAKIYVSYSYIASIVL